MKIDITHRIDEGEGFRYEYDLFEFVLGSRVVRARRYTDDAVGQIAVLGMLDDDRPGVPFSLYDAPEAAAIVAELKARGFRNISVLGPEGYTPLDEKRLDQKQ